MTSRFWQIFVAVAVVAIVIKLLVVAAHGQTAFYPCKALTGSGGTGAVDEINGALLNDGDGAFVIMPGGIRYVYNLKDGSPPSETLPQVIIPNTNPGNKWWDLAEVMGNAVQAGAEYHGNRMQIDAEGDVWITANAWYSYTEAAWHRDDISEEGFGMEVMGRGNIGGMDSYPGVAFWRCMPRQEWDAVTNYVVDNVVIDNGSGDWQTYSCTVNNINKQPYLNPGEWDAVDDLFEDKINAYGWEACSIFTYYKDMLVAGDSIEVDGRLYYTGDDRGVYGRVMHSTADSVVHTGMGQNVYGSWTGRDDDTRQSWFFGIENDVDGTDDYFKVMRAPTGGGESSPGTYADLFTIAHNGNIVMGSSDATDVTTTVNSPTLTLAGQYYGGDVASVVVDPAAPDIAVTTMHPHILTTSSTGFQVKWTDTDELWTIENGLTEYPNAEVWGASTYFTIDLNAEQAACLYTDTGFETNGTMEADSDWYDFGTPTAQARSAAQVHDGTYSWMFTSDSAGDGISNTTYTTTNFYMYTVTAWVYPDDYTGVTVKIRDGQDSTYLYDHDFTDLTQDAWNQISFRYVEYYEGSGAFIVFCDDTGATGDWYIDDVTIGEIYYPQEIKGLVDGVLAADTTCTFNIVPQSMDADAYFQHTINESDAYHSELDVMIQGQQVARFHIRDTPEDPGSEPSSGLWISGIDRDPYDGYPHAYGFPPILWLYPAAVEGGYFSDMTYDGNACDIDVVYGPLNLRPINGPGDLIGEVRLWNSYSSVKLRCGSAMLGDSIDIYSAGGYGTLNTTGMANGIRIYNNLLTLDDPGGAEDRLMWVKGDGGGSKITLAPSATARGIQFLEDYWDDLTSTTGQGLRIQTRESGGNLDNGWSDALVVSYTQTVGIGKAASEPLEISLTTDDLAIVDADADGGSGTAFSASALTITAFIEVKIGDTTLFVPATSSAP